MCTDWMEIERKREPNTVCDTSSHRIEIERKREPNTVYNTCVCLIGTHRMCEHVSHTVLGSRFLSVSIQSVHIQCANIHSSNVWTYTRIIHCVGLSLSFCLHSIGTHPMCEHTLVKRVNIHSYYTLCWALSFFLSPFDANMYSTLCWAHSMCTDGWVCPTQCMIYVHCLIARFREIILRIGQYKYSKSFLED